MGHYNLLHSNSKQFPTTQDPFVAGIPDECKPVMVSNQNQPKPTLVCDYAGGRFELLEQGLFFIGTDKDGIELPPRWICSPLYVIAKTRDAKSGEWGRLIEWRDDDLVKHQWAMPLALLQEDASEVRRELASLGLAISPNRAARDLLASYLQVFPVEERARCVDKLGWHGDVYVTATEAIGQNAELIVFQNTNAIEPALSVSGTAKEWRDSIARLASGNSRLVFAL
jgi:putative DNA primase/helicase